MRIYTQRPIEERGRHAPACSKHRAANGYFQLEPPRQPSSTRRTVRTGRPYFRLSAPGLGTPILADSNRDTCICRALPSMAAEERFIWSLLFCGRVYHEY